MKVTDIRRKLAATLAAAGLMAPGAAIAADLNTNLVVNGGFENVDLNATSENDFNSPLILDWSGTGAFAYSHDGSSSSTGFVPNYANGTPLATGGHWYFTANNAIAGPDLTAPGQFFQDIDVSTGASGALIAGGTAAFRIGAFMSSYANDGDIGHVNVRFLTAADVSLAAADVAYRIPEDEDPFDWAERFQGGLIPVGTHHVRVSVYGVAMSGGPDGYIDNVEFQVTNTVVQPALSLTIDRSTGAMTLANQTGSAVNISNYAITSAGEALDATNWRSIADNYDAGSPGPNQVDAIHNWNETSLPADHAQLSEEEPALQGASLPNGQSVNLGNAGAWIPNPDEDLIFRYFSAGSATPTTGVLIYTGNGGDPLATGDLNADGAISAADWVILRTNQHANLTAMSLAEAYRLGDLTGDLANNHADFVEFKAVYDATNGVGAFAAMLASVPESPSATLVLVAGMCLIPAIRRSRQPPTIVPAASKT